MQLRRCPRSGQIRHGSLTYCGQASSGCSGTQRIHKAGTVQHDHGRGSWQVDNRPGGRGPPSKIATHLIRELSAKSCSKRYVTWTAKPSRHRWPWPCCTARACAICSDCLRLLPMAQIRDATLVALSRSLRHRSPADVVPSECGLAINHHDALHVLNGLTFQLSFTRHLVRDELCTKRSRSCCVEDFPLRHCRCDVLCRWQLCSCPWDARHEGIIAARAQRAVVANCQTSAPLCR